MKRKPIIPNPCDSCRSPLRYYAVGTINGKIVIHRCTDKCQQFKQFCQDLSNQMLETLNTFNRKKTGVVK